MKKNTLKNKKGFTLTELIVVIVIIGILAAVLIPTLTGYINKAKESAAEQEAIQYKQAHTVWLVEKDYVEDANKGFEEYCIYEVELKLENGASLKNFVDVVDTDVDESKYEYGFIYIATNGKEVEYVASTGKLTVK